MPVINNSFVEPAEGDVPVFESAEPQPSTSAEGQIPRNNSNKANEAEVKVKKFGEEPLQLTLGGKKYKLVEVADDGPELQKDVVEDILKVPQAKVSHMGGAQMQGLRRCISNKKYWEILKAKEDKKMKEKEVEKQKAEQAAKAEQKRIAKKVVKDKCTVNRKCCQPKIIESSSSSDETEEMVLDDDSSTDESGEGSDVFYEGTVNHCAECDTCFKGRECQTAIRCDTPYCRRWFHVKCTGLKRPRSKLKKLSLFASIVR